MYTLNPLSGYGIAYTAPKIGIIHPYKMVTTVLRSVKLLIVPKHCVFVFILCR